MMRRLFSAVAVLGIAGSTSIPSAQSLADLARQEEARRKAIKAPAQVITNEGLRDAGLPAPTAPGTPAPPAPGAVAPSPSGGQSATPNQPGTPAAPAPGSPARDESSWRQRISTARESLARSQTFQEALQSRINALSADFVNRDDPAQRGQIGVDRQKALAELERVKQEVQQHQKAIADIQEEARKAGVPAGWVR